ncbi:transcription factor HES-3 [Heterocephalus glaber]|uniref:Transcription factor HES-3 n=1 Tax=Heterocephalus glaber TaxID=10181 RepID=A0AAX6RSE2_HETGA|nr:transcription factor HES-3 [Heterocephalus glaber]XP_021099218.1 transcription factor HES-3 [Heterocephalus glaber]
MEKKRRARINLSLEQLRSLLEKHYSHQIRKRKLEKADVLELSVKYMKSLQSSLQGLWPMPSGAESPSGFRGCLPGVNQLLQRAEEGSGGPCFAPAPERAGGSTTDSARPGPDAPAPAPARPLSPRLLLPRGLPGSTNVPAQQPAPGRQAESPGPGPRVWRPW